MDQNALRQFTELEADHFWFRGRREIFGHLLKRILDGSTDLSILDVGCGAGGMIGMLAVYGAVTGIDTSPELIEVCRKRGFDRTFVASAYEPPVEPHSFDLVTLFDALEHLPDDSGALRILRGTMVRGGLLFASVPAYQFLYANNDRVAQHYRRYTAGGLRLCLQAAGLEPVKVTYFNTLLFPVILPAVLAKKVQERVRDPGVRTNLSHEVPAILHWLLAAIMASERLLLERRRLPFGHSLIAIARNPG